MRSSLEIYDLAIGSARVVLQTDLLIEAPNWDPDGQSLLVNGDGRLFRVALDAPRMAVVESGRAVQCNNDHGISPDGRQIVLSSHHGGGGSEIFLMPAAGGVARKISPGAPSWGHGWSRIYYNRDRDGHSQIWVMCADGSGKRKLFADDYVNWFPHPSPDGRHLLYLAYPAGTLGHPRDLPVALVLCDPEGGNRRRILEFNGGQGTMNVPNWAPDGSAFAFVRYATPEA